MKIVLFIKLLKVNRRRNIACHVAAIYNCYSKLVLCWDIFLLLSCILEPQQGYHLLKLLELVSLGPILNYPLLCILVLQMAFFQGRL